MSFFHEEQKSNTLLNVLRANAKVLRYTFNIVLEKYTEIYILAINKINQSEVKNGVFVSL